MICKRLSSFLQDENGATTVDTVFLMAAVVGLGLATTVTVNSGTADLSHYVEDQLTDMMDQNLDLSAYALLGRDRDESWRAALQERVAGFNENRLTRGYNNLYARAQTGGRWARANRIDRLGVYEAEMIARGMAIPDGNASYTDLHAEWLATYS